MQLAITLGTASVLGVIFVGLSMLVTAARGAERCRRFSASRPDHRLTSSASLPVSVYWNCARLIRVEIWMSCTGWK